MKLYKNNSRAFTILDILLIAAIISLLFSVFLFRVTEAKKKADDAHMQVEAQQISTALTLYKESEGKVPYSVNTTTSNTDNIYKENQPEYADNLKPLVSGGFIPQIPKSPSGQSYIYAISGDLKEAVFVVQLNKKSSNGSQEGEKLCISSSGENSNNTNLCSDVINSLIEPPRLIRAPVYISLQRSGEEFLLEPMVMHEVSYHKNSVEAMYGIDDGTNKNLFSTSFSGSTFTIAQTKGWSCDTYSISQDEIANCTSSYGQNIQITNYNSSEKKVRVLGNYSQ